MMRELKYIDGGDKNELLEELQSMLCKLLRGEPCEIPIVKRINAKTYFQGPVRDFCVVPCHSGHQTLVEVMGRPACSSVATGNASSDFSDGERVKDVDSPLPARDGECLLGPEEILDPATAEGGLADYAGKSFLSLDSVDDGKGHTEGLAPVEEGRGTIDADGRPCERGAESAMTPLQDRVKDMEDRCDDMQWKLMLQSEHIAFLWRMHASGWGNHYWDRAHSV